MHNDGETAGQFKNRTVKTAGNNTERTTGSSINETCTTTCKNDRQNTAGESKGVARRLMAGSLTGTWKIERQANIKRQAKPRGWVSRRRMAGCMNGTCKSTRDRCFWYAHT